MLTSGCHQYTSKVIPGKSIRFNIVYGGEGGMCRKMMFLKTCLIYFAQDCRIVLDTIYTKTFDQNTIY